MPKDPVFTNQDVEEILRIIDRLSNIEIRLESGDTAFCIRKGVGTKAERRADLSSEALRVDTLPGIRKLEMQDVPGGAEPRTDRLEPGTTVIRAGTPGTFYRASSPSDPPFVEVGTQVNPEDPVGLIEVMKLFATVKAGMSGRIISAEAENGSVVAEGDVLFVVRVE